MAESSEQKALNERLDRMEETLVKLASASVHPMMNDLLEQAAKQMISDGDKTGALQFGVSAMMLNFVHNQAIQMNLSTIHGSRAAERHLEDPNRQLASDSIGSKIAGNSPPVTVQSLPVAALEAAAAKAEK